MCTFIVGKSERFAPRDRSHQLQLRSFHLGPLQHIYRMVSVPQQPCILHTNTGHYEKRQMSGWNYMTKFPCRPVSAAPGWTLWWEALPYPKPSTAGTEACRTRNSSTAASATTTGQSTKPHPRGVALTVWLTAARGLSATPPAQLFMTSEQDKRWVRSRCWSTWASTCRRWPSSRGWIPGRCWTCSTTGPEMFFFNAGTASVSWRQGRTQRSKLPNTTSNQLLTKTKRFNKSQHKYNKVSANSSSCVPS